MSDRIDVPVNIEGWLEMTPHQRNEFTFSVLNYLVAESKKKTFKNSFLSVTGGIIGGILIWLPLVITNTNKTLGG